MRKLFLSLLALLAFAPALAQNVGTNISNPPTSLPPSGVAGGDLGGSYPNPTVLSVSNVTTGVLAGANGGTGVANTGKTITLGGNLITSGPFNATLIFPATGSWTYPLAGSSLAPLLSPSFTTPTLGVAAGTSLALNGATIGTYTLSQIGSTQITGATTTSPDVEVWMTGDTVARVALGLNTTDVGRISFGPGNAVRDVFIERAGVANKRSGAPDSATPVAQTDSVQNVVVGTSNTSGADRAFHASLGTGSGFTGSHVFKTGTQLGSGTTQHTAVQTFAIGSATSSNLAFITLGNSTTNQDGIQVSTAGAHTYSFWANSVQVATFASSGIALPSAADLSISSGRGIIWNSDTFIGRRGAASVLLGAADTASPVAQTLSVQSVIAGTSNTAGASWTRDASQGTGTGAGGSHIWRVAPAGSTGTSQNALVPALTIDSTKLAAFTGALGAASGAFGGCTISTDGICVSGTTTISGVATFGSNVKISNAGGSDAGLFNGSTAGTIGMQASSSFNFAGSTGPYYAMRGNTYSTSANQRGNVYITAGNPSTPGATEGTVNFITNDIVRLTLGNAGATSIIGTLSVSAMANAATTSAVCYNTGTGVLSYDGTLGTCTVSTITAKDLDAPLQPKEGLALVMAMRPWIYHLKPNRPTYTPGAQMGMIAEYAREIDPRLVAVNPDGSVAGFRYEQYTAALTAAIQELKSRIDYLEAR